MPYFDLSLSTSSAYLSLASSDEIPAAKKDERVEKRKWWIEMDIYIYNKKGNKPARDFQSAHLRCALKLNLLGSGVLLSP